MFHSTLFVADHSHLINPSITLYAGSQYFYEEYYSTSRLGNRKGQGKGALGTATSTATNVEILEASEFNLLNVELSLPLQYYHNQFIFSVTPTLAFPQTSATITTVDTIIKEDLENVLYWSVGVSYWFYTKKNR